MKYRVEFKDGKVGRDRGVEPREFTFDPEDAEDLIEIEVYKIARTHLASRGVDVVIGWGPPVASGTVYAGFHPVAQFTVTLLEDEGAAIIASLEREDQFFRDNPRVEATE